MTHVRSTSTGTNTEPQVRLKKPDIAFLTSFTAISVVVGVVDPLRRKELQRIISQLNEVTTIFGLIVFFLTSVLLFIGKNKARGRPK